MMRPSLKRMHGMSLVEIMVGLVIGMGVVLVVYQIVTTFEGQKRTTIEGAGAQENGLFAIAALDQDIRMAGWGLTGITSPECSSIEAALDDRPINGFSLMPVSILQGADGAPDSITVISGTSAASSAPTTISDAADPTALKVRSIIGIQDNDLVLVANSDKSCTLGQVTDSPENLTIKRKPGGINPTRKARDGWPQELTGSKLYSLGSLTHRTYRINDATQALEAQDLTSAAPVGIADNIVGIKAQYGFSPAGSNDLQWVDPVDQWTNPSDTDMQQVKAIRLFILARSPLREKPDAAGACTTTADRPAPSWASKSTQPVKLPGSDWQCFRYRAFETVVPLRNIIWANP